MPSRRKRKYDLQKQISKVWYEELIVNIKFREGVAKATPALLAKYFQTSRTVAIHHRKPKDYLQRNIDYWSRIARGERAIKDIGLIQRIDKYMPFWWINELLVYPLTEILLNPRCNTKKLNSVIQALSPSLENLLFTRDNEELVQRISYNSERIMISADFLTYQLVLIRMMAMGKFGGHPKLSIKEATLLLLRILMATPLKKVGDSILREYYYFFSENAQELNITVPKVPAFIVEQNPLPYVIEMCLPEAKHLNFMQSFSAYKIYHLELIAHAKDSLYGNRNEVLFGYGGADQILYWADRFSDCWLSNSTEKIALYNKQHPAFLYISKAIVNDNYGYHRIW